METGKKVIVLTGLVEVRVVELVPSPLRVEVVLLADFVELFEEVVN